MFHTWGWVGISYQVIKTLGSQIIISFQPQLVYYFVYFLEHYLLTPFILAAPIRVFVYSLEHLLIDTFSYFLLQPSTHGTKLTHTFSCWVVLYYKTPSLPPSLPPPSPPPSLPTSLPPSLPPVHTQAHFVFNTPTPTATTQTPTIKAKAVPVNVKLEVGNWDITYVTGGTGS